MRRLLPAACIGIVLACAPPASALLLEQPVRATRLNEVTPAADFGPGGFDYVAWAQSRPRRPNVYDAYVQRDGDPRLKLNAVGRALVGGIDYPTVAYQQIYRGRSDVKLFDLATMTRSNPPRGVNTRRWEYPGGISGHWLLLGRDDTVGPTRRVLLYDLASGSAVLLASVTRPAHYLDAGQVTGDYVAWTKCTPVCNVFRRDIAATATTRFAKPRTNPPRWQYAASVTSDGTVYAARSGRGCGTFVKIVRFGVGDPATGTVIAALPRGVDIQYTYAREKPDGSVEVFYDRGRCPAGRFNIYQVTDPGP